MRSWALELCQADPEAFDSFLKVTPNFGYLSEDLPHPRRYKTRESKLTKQPLRCAASLTSTPRIWTHERRGAD